uniref:uncharacterized protein LOC117604513 isoform X1 n=2 Tax=Osmia lignaria TaxID=473952 RepID=UPI001479570C|nr:uncharacterized protein LOC117604513 isoform X1 [Osmia lignaria]XP_034180520.1 uncharacterized protein LOC117604513 isoform X1 [Osmia lignaria]XP_034180521.1 uncharacterized protein LOC117604513 isoform X1 [Osmia lignaria]
MEKKQVLASDTSLPDPLNVFVKKIGRRIHDPEGKSKETLKELLMTNLMPNQHQPTCLPYTTNLEICDEINGKVEDSSENNKDKDNDKQVEETIKPGIEPIKEEEDESECSSSDMDEIELSFDGKWLRDHLQLPLKMAIKELVAKKPYDPVNYLGFWLMHYKRCQERNQWRLEKDQELNYLRSVIREPIPEVEESIPVDMGEEEEETRDWNFEHYNIM